MASENETVAEIVRKMRDEWALCYFSEGTKRKDGGYSHFCTIDTEEFSNSIEAAHRREIAKLEHWIKSAARWIKCHDVYHTSGDDVIKQAKEILNDNRDNVATNG